MPEFDATVRYAPYPHHPGYMLGSDGSVWGLGRKKPLTWRQLRPTPAGGGYLAITVQLAGRRRTVGIHRAILEAFVGPPPQPRMECRHLDGNPMNNRLENLAWGTFTENNRDRITHRTIPRGERVGNARLTAGKVAVIRGLAADGVPLRKIADRFGVRMATVWYVVKGITWKDAPHASTS